MKYILTGTEMAQADRATSETIGIPSLVLMERAALSVADEITARHPVSTAISIICGPGNNGADGIAAGRILIDRGYTVQFLLLSETPPPEGSSMAVQQSILKAYGMNACVFSEEELLSFRPGVVIDAMFGTGLIRPLRGAAASACACMELCRKQFGTAVVGLDIPSGVSAEDGSILGTAPHCDYTVTFAFLKRGHALFPGCTYCGEVILREIGITSRAFEKEPAMIMPEDTDIACILPDRRPDGNKGTFGRITIIAGSLNMCGAALLSAEAALRCGAGMVRVVTCEENRRIVQEKLPEALLTTYREKDEDLRGKVLEALKWADTAAVGPGLGRSSTAAAIMKTVLEYAADEAGEAAGLRGLVIDADAIRLVASSPELRDLLVEHRKETACILTPHPGEFSHLAGISIEEYLGDRPRYLRVIADSLGCAVIGKDARTMTASSGTDRICLIRKGNSGMGTAGSGDVLTGTAAALLSSFTNPENGLPDAVGSAYKTAAAAAYIHACAGDLAAAGKGEYALIASDICACLGTVMKDLKDRKS